MAPVTQVTAPTAPTTEPDLVDLIVEFLVSKEPALADRAADMTADLRAEFGGQRWYVSARPETERGERVRKILELFNGRNATEVARRLHISRATVYRAIKQPGIAPGQYPRPAIGVSSPKAPKATAKRGAENGNAPSATPAAGKSLAVDQALNETGANT
jgi:hypothetical protein